MLLWELYQHRRIADANRRVAGIDAAARVTRKRTRGELEDLQDRLDQLILVNHAMWNLLAEHAEVTTDDLLAEVERLDLEDGVADGVRTALPDNCECGAKVHPRAERCVFCGADAPARSLFDVL
ncbi:MAG: hypothetical protein AAF962_14650 [Actinomycetota bacterium]